MSHYVFPHNATFSWCATLFQIIAFNTVKAELMALASCCCELVWDRKLAIKLDLPQLKPTAVSKDNTSCIALTNMSDSMHVHGHSKDNVLRVCFIPKLIRGGILNAQQCPTAVQTEDLGTKALPRLPFGNFTNEIFGSKNK